MIRTNPAAHRLCNTNYSDFGSAGLTIADSVIWKGATLISMQPAYTLGHFLSGELKIGGKYKIKDRSNARFEDFTPYYLGKWQALRVAAGWHFP